MAKKKEVIDEPLEKQLWKAADKLRKNIDAAEYSMWYWDLSFYDIYLFHLKIYIINSSRK